MESRRNFDVSDGHKILFSFRYNKRDPLKYDTGPRRVYAFIRAVNLGVVYDPRVPYYAASCTLTCVNDHNKCSQYHSTIYRNLILFKKIRLIECFFVYFNNF